MAILNKEIHQRVKALGGESSETEDTLIASLASIKLPKLFTKEYLFEEFDYYCTDEHKSALLDVLGSSTVDYKNQLLPVLAAMAKAFDFGANPEAEDLLTWGIGEAAEKNVLQLTGLSDLMYTEIGFGNGWYPDLYNVFLNDPNPANPIVYSTDHTSSWQVDTVHAEGALEEFLDSFLTPTQVIEGVRSRLP